MRVEADLVRTDTQTDKPTTVTLASACARRGLINAPVHVILALVRSSCSACKIENLGYQG